MAVIVKLIASLRIKSGVRFLELSRKPMQNR